MLSPECIRSNALLISVSGITWVIIGSISILPSMYQSTIFGTSVRPRAPPKAVPPPVWRPAGGPARAREGGPAPRPAGNGLDRPVFGPAAGRRHADDDALAP